MHQNPHSCAVAFNCLVMQVQMACNSEHVTLLISVCTVFIQSLISRCFLLRPTGVSKVNSAKALLFLSKPLANRYFVVFIAEESTHDCVCVKRS